MLSKKDIKVIVALVMYWFIVCALSMNVKAATVNDAMKERYQIQETWYEEIEVEITYYTDLYIENGTQGKDALGNKLVTGIIASDRRLPKGKAKYIINGMTYTNNDVGNSNYIKIQNNGIHTIDMFMPRKAGENDKQYYRRVNNMGRTRTIAKFYIVD